MGTQKRERQKANRLQRQMEEQKAAKVSAVKRNVLRWIIVAVLALGAVVLIAWIGGAFSGDDEADSTTSTVPPTLATTTTIAFETPEKPEVELPAETPTELQVTTLVEGDGPEAADGDSVTVHYVGVLSEDGTEFDNSYDSERPFSVVLGSGSVIDGWEQGLVGVQAGERVQLDIPADLAYGDTGSGDIIQPGDAISFVIDVLAVTPGAGS
ncbi:MAG: FKBP-type peptidyl-prolyl cis-trans isomerase [Acidimicrobiia bacterium]